jgi:hypothetical protein
LGCVAAIDSSGRTIWIADAHRDNGKRFVVRADEKLTAFIELVIGNPRRKVVSRIAWLHSTFCSSMPENCRGFSIEVK